MPDATTSVWRRLAEQEPGPVSAEGGGIWDVLRERINPASYRPVQSPETGAVPLTSRQGDPYYILTNPPRYTYLRLGPDDHHVWALMDGTRSVKDLVVEYFTRFGALAFGRVGQLVMHLKLSRMLVDPPMNLFAAVRRAVARDGWQYVPQVFWEIMTGRRKLTIRKVDGVIEWLYRHGGWILYTRPLQVVYLALSGIGGWLFAQHITSGQFNLFQAGGSYARGLLLLYVLNYASIAVHELAHALTCKHYGARINGAGALLYFGLPAYYVDTTDIWTKPARARIATSWAGPYSGLILAGLSSILVALMPASPIAPILHRLAFIWVLILVFNLIPLLELDGYFMLIDWLEIPMLRARALAFVRKELWAKLRRREPLTHLERLLAWFGVLSVAFSVFALFLAYRFWTRRVGPVARELWAGGTGSKALLALLLLVLALPLVVGWGGRLLRAGRAATGAVRTVWRKPRRRTLREREALLHQVRFLSPLAQEQRSEVAARMERSTFRPGDAVITHGEVGDRFYVIESGTAEVFVENEAQPRTVLSTGDYFGELALLYGVHRTATVRAASPLSVLWLRKGDFERLLASHVAASARVDEAIDALERLRAFAIFAGLSSRELDELARHLVHERFPAGATVVQEGAPGDSFYLIDSGQAEATTGGRRVRIMQRGDYFGEIALLLDVPRTATVRALTPLEVFKLSRADFDALVGTMLAQIAGTLEEVGRERLADVGSAGR